MGRDRFEQLIWDLQYFFGFWRYIDGTPDGDVSAAINRHLHGGSILDLGCGTGNTVRILGPYVHYQGVDLSNVAVRTARKRYASGKNQFTVADIRDYQPTRCFDVILLSEILDYIELEEVTAFLERYQRNLSENGVFVVRLWNKELRKDWIDLLVRNFEVLENRPVSVAELAVVVTFR